VEVSLKVNLPSHEFVLLLLVPGSNSEEEEAEHSTIDDPLEECGPFEAPVTAGFVLASRNAFQAAEVRLGCPARFAAGLAGNSQVETAIDQ
jgi:hypothetical protein